MFGKRRFLKKIAVVGLLAMVIGLSGACASKPSQEEIEKAENIEMIAGQKDVKGEGIEIKIDDADRKDRNRLVLDIDLAMVFQTLEFNGGAEAVSINGERVISTREIKSDGMKVRINGNEYDAPYVIKAIGDREKMEEAFDLEFDYMKKNLVVSVEKKEEIVIPKYEGFMKFKYAKPVE